MTTAPFALLVESPTPPVDRTPVFTYDRFRQLNVAASGAAVVDIADVQATTYTHNSTGHKKNDGFASAPRMLFGPSYTHNSSGHKKDDD